MSSSSSSHKLHPIYVALDSHQYSRAVKLASALPESDVLGQALLAVALQKSGQRYICLQTLQKILAGSSSSCSSYYYELQRAIFLCPEHYEKKQTAGVAPVVPTKSRGNKKNKKKPSSAPAATAPKEVQQQQQEEMDWIQQLEQAPTVPDGWDAAPADDEAAVITNETILATLALPLHAMRMHATVYQMYARAALASKGDELVNCLSKSFTTGLKLLQDFSFSHQQRQQQQLQLLGSMQVSALQLARLEHSSLYTKWAAQTALWQTKLISTSSPMDNTDEKMRQRQSMLPRLAESLAKKVVEQQQGAEDCLLYLATLQQQGKKQQELQFLEELLSKKDDDKSQSEQQRQQQQQQDQFSHVISLSKQQLLEKQAHVLMDLELYDRASKLYQGLVKEHMDQWSFWMGCLKSLYQIEGNECIPKMEALVEHVVNSCETTRVPRGPYLMRVELAAVRIRGLEAEEEEDDEASEKVLTRLQESIIEYANYWAPRASCTFTDLEPYVELLCHAGNKDVSLKLLDWAETMQRESSVVATTDATDAKEQRSLLRQYIFSVKLTYRLVELLNQDNSRLPVWSNLVKVWQATTRWAATDDSAKEEVQKENQPGDELMLVTAKRLLQDNSNDVHALTRAATCLEMAMSHSPYNSHLNIAAIDVYARLNAVSRSLDLYEQLHIKHVQLDSCSYLILPRLVQGGLYQQALEESNGLLKFHASTFKDTGDFMGRSMERGTLSKANEFLEWQQTRINNSLALLEAKGRIMDCAPLIAQSPPNKKSDKNDARPLAVQYGIIGGDNDMERATNMTREAHNHLGAPSIVSLVNTTADEYSDNRDFSILSHQMMQPISTLTKEQIVADSIRSGHVHGLLIRAALCMDACRGPKKGKVQKPSQELEKRCGSLLAAMAAASSFVQSNNNSLAPSYPELLQACLSLCRVLVVVVSGISLENDSLSERERSISDFLPIAASQVKSAQTILVSKATVATVCQMLPDCLIAVYCLLEMNANAFSKFGWGKRKRWTKSGAGALAEFALALRDLTTDLIAIFSSLSADAEQKRIANIVDSLARDVEEANLDKQSVHKAAQHIVRGQQVTRDAVVPYLVHIVNTLSTFDVPDLGS